MDEMLHKKYWYKSSLFDSLTISHIFLVQSSNPTILILSLFFI